MKAVQQNHNAPKEVVPEIHGAPRVLLVAPQPFFENRGTPMNVRAMAETLGSNGVSVDLLTFPYGEEVIIPGVRILRCLSLPWVARVPVGPSFAKFFLDIFLTLHACWLVFRNRYALLHGVEEGAVIVGALGLLSRTPYVFDMDSCMPTQLRDCSFPGAQLIARGVEVLERFFVRRARVVLTVCEALTIKAKEITPSVDVVQIEDFPTEGADSASQENIDRLRQEFSIDSSERVLVYTGNFEKYQGIKLLVESFALALKRLSKGDIAVEPNSVRLVLVGGGDTDSQKVSEMRSLANSLGIAERVLCTGNRPADEMSAWMALSQVLVSPRIEGENTPLKLYSYMMAGRSIVATSIYSHTQVLNEENSFLAAPMPEPFSQAILAALEEGDAAGTAISLRAAAAKELVESRYSRASFDRRLVGMYSVLLNA